MVEKDAPFISPFNLQPVKDPRLNKGASVHHNGLQRIPHICTSEGG